MKKVLVFRQHDAMDCGPACLCMVASAYKRHFTLHEMREKSGITRNGSSLLGISKAAQNIGFQTSGLRISFERLKNAPIFPLIVHWQGKHFVVVEGISRYYVSIADPALGRVRYSHDEFVANWAAPGNDAEYKGICLQLEPTPDFFTQDDTVGKKAKKSAVAFLFSFVSTWRKLLVPLIPGVLVISMIGILFPLLTRSIIDYGISTHDTGFITIVLFAQLVLFLSRAFGEICKSWTLLYVSAKVNISIAGAFLNKLMRLPVSFFSSRTEGDIIQRLNDHNKIQTFLDSSTLNFLSSMIYLIVLSGMLLFFFPLVFFVFLAGAILMGLWIKFFVKNRNIVEYNRIDASKRNQDMVFEIIRGVKDIKIAESEEYQRSKWETIQNRLFAVNSKSLKIAQFQFTGASFFNEFKNILITFLCANAVIRGDISLGTMIAVHFIAGQMSNPLDQLVRFINQWQDARIGVERIREVLDEKSEQEISQAAPVLIASMTLSAESISFTYPGSHKPVLDEIEFEIPEGGITALVGKSGSGKSTLLSLMLGLYHPDRGIIRVGGVNLKQIPLSQWRKRYAAVLQGGYIFQDTLMANIVMSQEKVDERRLYEAVEIACLDDVIDSQPLGIMTKLGAEGAGLSGGQKQRILIARAVYKQPDFLFFDEATNSLDAMNEKTIVDNLQRFFSNRTVVIIAHRLSTVAAARHLLVMQSGKIAEKGSHRELMQNRSVYYDLVVNQTSTAFDELGELRNTA
ncbi:MAG: peptidase domain-containing ABC transporter [Bacteroidetes bacterium]|nr:peptidase domain-containing ABC transporter [Bacteroidota bacterium]MBU1719834.1 peptidase domain-containing ABC transporter [Bacteroidota bacterium]